MTTFQQRTADLQQEIFKEDYYPNWYVAVLKHYGMTEEGVTSQQYSPAKLSEMLGEFWWCLPDSPAIRSATFFKLCDLCQEEIDQSDDDDVNG